MSVDDPYEPAQPEARLITPTPAPRSRRVVITGLVLAGILVGGVIVMNVAGLVTGKSGADSHPVPKPTTMTHAQSDNFAAQQRGQAQYMEGQDKDKGQQSAEDTVLGNGADVANDPYGESGGVPKKTKAQDDAEHGRAGQKSEAQMRQEKAALEAEHRRQNDLDSSPVSLDFSDYFDKDKVPVADAATATTVAAEPLDEPGATPRRRSAFADVLAEEEDPEGVRPDPIRQKKAAHDPKEDYSFDSSFGKLYRLMEDTVIETVLVNRLTGTAMGPVIVMVRTDVYSESRAHLLIPRGTRLLGTVSAVGNLNQERLFVAFHRMIMPDGYSVSLDRFKGLDVVGQTGLRDLVNHHYVQIFGASLAVAAVSATTQIGNNSSGYGYNWGTSMRNGASEGLGQSAQRIMERFLNILPTFTIRERERVTVMLSNDLLLPDTTNHTMDPDL